jgi:hypothetical protein
VQTPVLPARNFVGGEDATFAAAFRKVTARARANATQLATIMGPLALNGTLPAVTGTQCGVSARLVRCSPDRLPWCNLPVND